MYNHTFNIETKILKNPSRTVTQFTDDIGSIFSEVSSISQGLHVFSALLTYIKQDLLRITS